MSKVRSLFLCLLPAIFFGCASSSNVSKTSQSAKGMPDWILGTSSMYPKSFYLTGTGSATDKKSAELDAINELVSIFGQSVSSAASTSRRMEMAQSKGIVAYGEESSIDQGVLREINQNDVIAVEIPEFYEEKSENKWYALAVMSKSKGSQIYSNMIDKNQAEINSIINQIKAEKEPNTMINYSRLDFAEEISKINEGYLKRLTILNPEAARKYDSIYTAVQIHKMKSDMAAKIPVCVKVDNDSDGRVAKAFQEVLASYGFNTTLGSNERYAIKCNILFFQRESSDNKTKFCEYVADCTLNDTFTGETLVPLGINGREGSPTYQNAEVRAKQKISSRIKNDFSKSFKSYLGDFSKAF